MIGKLENQESGDREIGWSGDPKSKWQMASNKWQEQDAGARGQDSVAWDGTGMIWSKCFVMLVDVTRGRAR